jgi:hypothetical protein
MHSNLRYACVNHTVALKAEWTNGAGRVPRAVDGYRNNRL